MRKTPKVVSGIGALSAAEMPSASTRRVSSGSMMPSSQSRAVAEEIVLGRSSFDLSPYSLARFGGEPEFPETLVL